MLRSRPAASGDMGSASIIISVSQIACDTRASTIGEVWSIVSFVPRDQDKKLPLIDELRRMIDDALPDLEEQDRKELLELRPPDGLRPITLASLPPSLRERFTEKDGRVGLVIEVRPAEHLDEWNGHDLIRFASAVRSLELADHERITADLEVDALA